MFNFFVNMQIPHLSFEDKYFDLIYSGSVFTHIDDMAFTWILELKRTLKVGGVLYLTAHPMDVIDKVLPSKAVENSIELQNIAIYVDERGSFSNVFYDIDYLVIQLSRYLNVLTVVPMAYGYQTAILLRKE